MHTRVRSSENLNGREGQQDAKPVDKCYFTGTIKKAFDVSLNFNYRGPLNITIEGRGDFKVTTISVRLLPLSVL